MLRRRMWHAIDVRDVEFELDVIGAAVTARWRTRGKISGGTRAGISSQSSSIEWKGKDFASAWRRETADLSFVYRFDRVPTWESRRQDRQDRVTRRSASRCDVTSLSRPTCLSLSLSLSLSASPPPSVEASLRLFLGDGRSRRSSRGVARLGRTGSELANATDASWVARDRFACVPRTEGLYGLCSRCRCVSRKKTSTAWDVTRAATRAAGSRSNVRSDSPNATGLLSKWRPRGS